jgi:putative ABC transport system substrate-binding protein
VSRRAMVLAVVLGVAVGIVPLGAGAQSARHIARIGFLAASSLADPRTRTFVDAFRQGLRDLGWSEGKNLTIEYRWAEEKTDRLPELARDLARLKVDVVVTATSPAVQAMKDATRTIPIVMANAGEPVASGFVASLARPEANITGLSMMGGEIVGKQLQILKEVVPNLTRLALFWNPTNASNAPQMQHAQEAARALRLELHPLEVRRAADIEGAFAATTRAHAGAIIVLLDSMLVANRTGIAEGAAKRRLPTMYGLVDHVRAGGLIAYGPNVADMYRRAATYVDKLLKGAKVADLPVEQPTKFELVVNLGAARGLGLTIPPPISASADQLIE